MLTISSAGRSVSEWPKYKYEWPKLKPPTPSLYFSNDWMQEMPERRICDLIYCLLVTEWYIVRWLLNNILFVGYWMIYCLLSTEWYIVFWLLKYCMLKYCDGLLLNIILKGYGISFCDLIYWLLVTEWYIVCWNIVLHHLDGLLLNII